MNKKRGLVLLITGALLLSGALFVLFGFPQTDDGKQLMIYAGFSGNFYAGLLFVIGLATFTCGLGMIIRQNIRRIVNPATKRAASILTVVLTFVAALISSIPILVVLLTAFSSPPFKEISSTGQSVLVVRNSLDPDVVDIWTKEAPFLYSLEKSGVLFKENTVVSSTSCSLISEDKTLAILCGGDKISVFE